MDVSTTGRSPRHSCEASSFRGRITEVFGCPFLFAGVTPASLLLPGSEATRASLLVRRLANEFFYVHIPSTTLARASLLLLLLAEKKSKTYGFAYRRVFVPQASDFKLVRAHPFSSRAPLASLLFVGPFPTLASLLFARTLASLLLGGRFRYARIPSLRAVFVRRHFADRKRPPETRFAVPDLSPFLQVVAGTRLTTEDWSDLWNKRVQTFLGRKRAGPKRSDENANVQDRLATLNWMLDVNHAMKPIGWSFTSFAPMVRAESVQKLERPPILILCTDQEATQLAAVAYLKNKKKAFVEHVSDPAHRSHNDASLALSAVGLLKFSTWSLNLYNLRFGPWQKSGAWSSKIQETAEQMSKSMSPSDPLLLEFFPDILADDGRGPDENTEEERRRFLAELPQKTCIRTKGIRASSSRFNSLTTAHAALDREWSILALVMTVVCVQSGWCKSASSLYAPGRFSGASAVRASGSKAAAKAAAKSELNAERIWNPWLAWASRWTWPRPVHGRSRNSSSKMDRRVWWLV